MRPRLATVLVLASFLAVLVSGCSSSPNVNAPASGDIQAVAEMLAHSTNYSGLEQHPYEGA